MYYFLHNNKLNIGRPILSGDQTFTNEPFYVRGFRRCFGYLFFKLFISQRQTYTYWSPANVARAPLNSNELQGGVAF